MRHSEEGLVMACLGMFGLSWVVGYSICRAALGSHWREVPATLRLGLAWAAGAAFSGITTFWAIVLAPGRRGLAVAIASAAALALSLVVSSRKSVDPENPPDPWPRRERVAWWVGAGAFVTVLVIWFAHGLDIGVGSPAGGWDAWSIWTQRARFFYLCPQEWKRGLDPVLAWAHPEYPNLVPSLIVHGWLPVGRCVTVAPVGLALMTQVSLLLLLVGFSQAAYPRSAWPWAFGVFYATIPLEWMQDIAWQYADRPLAVFLLAGTGCLALALRQGQRHWMLLAGLFWGAAAFCKDEGKAALVIGCLGAFVVSLSGIRLEGPRRGLGSLALMALGLVPGLGSLALQHAWNPVPSNLIAHMTTTALTDRSRSAVILQFLLDRIRDPSRGGMWIGCALALVTLWPWLRRRELWLLWLIPGAQLLVYGLIFQLTPMDLKWHLDTALPRLLFHIGPLVFLAASWLILEAKLASES